MKNFGSQNHTKKFCRFLEVLFALCQVNQDVVSVNKLFSGPQKGRSARNVWLWLSHNRWKIRRVKTAGTLAKDEPQPFILVLA